MHRQITADENLTNSLLLAKFCTFYIRYAQYYQLIVSKLYSKCCYSQNDLLAKLNQYKT